MGVDGNAGWLGEEGAWAMRNYRQLNCAVLTICMPVPGLPPWTLLMYLHRQRATGLVCQICSAYWPMVRSLENLPMLATLSMALRTHCV